MENPLEAGWSNIGVPSWGWGTLLHLITNERYTVVYVWFIVKRLSTMHVIMQLQWVPVGSQMMYYAYMYVYMYVCMYRIVPGKRPWVLAAQAPKFEGGRLHEEGA